MSCDVCPQHVCVSIIRKMRSRQVSLCAWNVQWVGMVFHICTLYVVHGDVYGLLFIQ